MNDQRNTDARTGLLTGPVAAAASTRTPAPAIPPVMFLAPPDIEPADDEDAED